MKKAKVNPAPHIPKTYDEIINATLSAKYTQTHERIRNLVMQYNTMPSKEYMQLVAHELSLH